MRTTIDIPIALKQKLIALAAAKNLKGYSSIIVKALTHYFEKQDKHRENKIKKLKGCLSKEEYNLEIKRINKARQNWRT